MSVISTIDCTLRDGGYINNWQFSEEFQSSVIKALIEANVEIIECGFINAKSGNDSIGTHFKSIEKVNEFLQKNAFNNSSAKFAVMMKLDEYNPKDLPNCNKAENCVSIIRVMIHKEEFENASEILKEIIKKGYELHIQPTIISHYSDEEIVKMLKTVEKIGYKSISIVDTFGALDEDEIKRKTLLFDKYVNKDAKISLHCHNNMSKAYQNVQSFLSSVSSKRDVYIDSTSGGIGRGAGNIATEILLARLKTERQANYSILPITNFCNNFISELPRNINEKDFYAYYLTAKKNMHPNYASFLILSKYSRKDIYKIIELIVPEKYETFDFNYIKSLCEVYMIKC